MDDLDILLSLVENPTRRRILQRIVREPSYPLQLSKELGVSTQAVMKNLTLLEQGGMVMRTDVRSDMGPNRAVYSPNMEFTLIVDMHGNAFSARILSTTDPTEDMEKRMEEIDERIARLETEISELMKEKELIASTMREREIRK